MHLALGLGGGLGGELILFSTVRFGADKGPSRCSM